MFGECDFDFLLSFEISELRPHFFFEDLLAVLSYCCGKVWSLPNVRATGVSQACKYFQGVYSNLAYFVNMVWIGVLVKTVR
jgi:hypothetical protein